MSSHSLSLHSSSASFTISQLDVKNAFLHIGLHKEVYIHPPLGYSVPEGHVYHLRRSLHVLKQAPHAWFECFTSVVNVVGFIC
jgi:hypothetical protein